MFQWIHTLLLVRVGGTKSSFDFLRLSFRINRAAANAIFVRLLLPLSKLSSSVFQLILLRNNNLLQCFRTKESVTLEQLKCWNNMRQTMTTISHETKNIQKENYEWLSLWILPLSSLVSFARCLHSFVSSFVLITNFFSILQENCKTMQRVDGREIPNEFSISRKYLPSTHRRHLWVKEFARRTPKCSSIDNSTSLSPLATVCTQWTTLHFGSIESICCEPVPFHVDPVVDAAISFLVFSAISFARNVTVVCSIDRNRMSCSRRAIIRIASTAIECNDEPKFIRLYRATVYVWTE